LRCLDPSDPHTPSRIVAFRTSAGSQPGAPAVDSLQFSPNERWLACALNHSDLHMIDLDDPQLAHTRLSSDGKRAGLAFSSQGDRLWAANATSADSLWQLPSPNGSSLPADPSRIPWTAGFNSLGDRVAVGEEWAVEIKMVDLTKAKVL